MDAADFTLITKRKLKELNAFRCANPDCRHYTLKQKLTPSPEVYTVGQAAHIEGKKPGAARYNKDQDDVGRSDISNALWLCGRCHALVDPDEKRFPTSLLFKWKEMSENFLNYSSPLFAISNRCFFQRLPTVPIKTAVMGGHLVIGPTNLEGVYTDCWIDVLSSAGRFTMKVDRTYRNEHTSKGITPKMLDDWHPFLSARGYDSLLGFIGTVNGGTNFLAYRVGVSCQALGKTIKFHSAWHLGRLEQVIEESYQLLRVPSEPLNPVLDWLGDNSETEDGIAILPIFSAKEIYVREYHWKKKLARLEADHLRWNDDPVNGTRICRRNLGNGVTLGFIEEKAKVALVVSTFPPPFADLIKTDGLKEEFAIL